MKSMILSKSTIRRNDTASPVLASTNLEPEQGLKLPAKDPLPPIAKGSSQQSNSYEKGDDKKPDNEVIERNHLPLKLFDGKKQSLGELNAESMTYIWLRRFKEIFLRMNTRTNDKDTPFIEFDMELAKTDMANTCDRYMENERIILMKQAQISSNEATKNEENTVKIDLGKKQEWDMKNLYAEVFKMSYKQNQLRTQAEQDELMPIKTGDDRPNFGNSIWWYSCDRASIYYQINSIVRLENFELLMSYRYYLSDLCRMIEFMYQKRKNEVGDIAHTFYRADNINENQLKAMTKRPKGQFISLLGFISTTSDINIAKGYAQKQRVYEGNKRVLFVISVKPKLPCTAFAYIERISFHPEEKEVLFSMGSSFIVETISEPAEGENYYTINLTASEINKSLVDDIRIKVDSCSPSGRAVLLARYLIELGEYRAARKYLMSLLIQAGDGGVLNNDISLAGVYSCLGLTYARQGLHGDALAAFKQALNTQARLEYSNNNALAEIHNNIGLAYVGLGHIDEAEATFAEAERMQLREPKANQQYLASIYSNIGHVHYKQKNFNEAEMYFKKAEKIYKQSTNRIAHDALELSLMKAEFLTNYGHLLIAHKKASGNRKPQDLYNEALKLYKSVLSDDDPKLMWTYINIMLTFVETKSYNEVTKYFDDPNVQKLINKQEANIFELNSSITQATMSSLYELVGACYASQNNFDKAIQVWKDAYVFERKARLEQLLMVTSNETSSILTADHNRFTHEWYRKTTVYYTRLSSEKTNLKQDQSLTSTSLCLGLLYSKLYNNHLAIECLKKATEDKSQSNAKTLFVAHLLLADIYKRKKQYGVALTNFDQAMKLIESSEYQDDLVLKTEVKLARVNCCEEKDVITQLESLKRSLKLYGSDTKYICLKAIVYDTLARYYLIQEDYEKFSYAIEQSIILKQLNLSQYHPSLAVNYIFRAECHVQQAETLHGESADIGYVRQAHYREALVSYECALEVYNLNLSNDNFKMRTIYYAMGNIMCNMDKLPEAMEKYDIAEENYAEDDKNDAQFEEDSEDSFEILMARASMHRHLAEHHARKNAYKEAIAEMTKAVNICNEQLPFSQSDTNENKMLAHDLSYILVSLRHLSKCYVHLGDLLGDAQNDDDGYFMALNINMKLIAYDKTVKKEEIHILKKISDYYENINEYDEALESLQKVAQLGDTSISVQYKLGRLFDLCNKPDEAVKNYRLLLAHPSISEQKHLKQIVQERLNAAQKLKESQNSHSDSSSPRHKDMHSFDNVNSLNGVRQDTTAMLDQEHRNNVNTDIINTGYDSFDNRVSAAAYLELEDFDKARRFYEKDIKQHSGILSNRNTFKMKLERIEQNLYMHNQQNMLPLLSKLYCSLVNEMKKIVTIEDVNVSTLIDSLVQYAVIPTKYPSHLEVTKSYVTAFDLYASESMSSNDELKQTLINIMSSTLNNFTQGKLKAQEIIDAYIQLSMTNEANQVRLMLLTTHHANEMEDTHSISGIGHHSPTAALHHYKELLMSSNDVNLRAICFLNILYLYKRYLHPDKQGKDIIDSLIDCLPKLNILDRRLLATLALEFLQEYDTDSSEESIIQELQKYFNSSFDKQIEDNMEPCMGLLLSKVSKQSAAEKYWRSIIKQINSNFSSRTIDLIQDSDTTIKEILSATEHIERENKSLFNHLAADYVKLADYLMAHASSRQEIGTYSYVKAAKMYKEAIKLLESSNDDTDRITNIKTKHQAAEKAAQHKT